LDIAFRWHRHLCELKRQKHPNKRLQNHFNKYGEQDLRFSILLGCDKEDLIKIEQYFIDSYNPWFNICKKAGNTLGSKHTEKSKQKNREAHLGKTPWNKDKKTGVVSSTQFKKGHIPWNKGMKGYNNNCIKKRSPVSLETREKQSISIKKYYQEHPVTEDKKRGMRERRHSDESKQKCRDSWVIRKLKKVA